MDKELYEALQKAYERKQGGYSVLSPESESDEDRKAFDRWVSALYKLRDLGFVKFRDNEQVLRDNEGGLARCIVSVEKTDRFSPHLVGSSLRVRGHSVGGESQPRARPGGFI